MTEIIKPPAAWAMHVDLNATDLQNDLGGQRLISIKSYVRNSERVYSGISVKDDIDGLGWTANMTPTKLRQTVDLANGRLISLDTFWDTKVNELRCAGVWIKNSQGWKWNFGVDMTPSSIDGALKKEGGKLTCVRVYTRPTNPDQNPPISFEEKFCAIWIQDDGIPWGWAPDITVPALGQKLDDELGRLISIDNHTPDSWSPNGEKLAAVWWKNVGFDVWFWNIGLDAAGLKKEFPAFCSYGMDLVPAGPVQFASLMYQFPKPSDPNAVSLVSFTGSGDGKLRDDLWQEIQWNFQEKNLTASTVSLTNAVMLSAAEGGWCWFSGNYTNPPGQNLLGLPLALAPSGTYPSTPWWQVSNNPKIGVFTLRAEDGTGKYQNFIAQAPITHAGFPAPAALPIQWPVFLGIQGPVEAVKLTNGKNWVTVAAQVCNGTNLKTSITHASVRLKDAANVILHEANFTDNLMIDQDNLGMPVSPPFVGKVTDSTAPLAKLYDGFEVPAEFETGTLKVQANIKFTEGDLECYGDARALTVKPAPVHVMTRLPYNKPGGTPIYQNNPNSPFRWHWGNGIGGTNFNAHSFPEHRYSYDLGVFDKNNNTFLDPAHLDKNENYYCWGLDVIAMLAGDVVFVAKAFEDNFGNVGNPNSKGANVVILHNKQADVFHLYAHFMQGSVVVKVGDTVSAGDKLGLVGNSGGSSEPHLHVGLSQRDANGFLRSLPMSFTKIKNGAGQVVSGVPVDGEFYS
jgi:hypothetical protein